MAKNEAKKKMGRPPLPFDWSKLDAILQYKASLIDAAEIMECHVDTIEKKIKAMHGCTFSEYRDKKMSKVRLTLVQKAIGMAQNGDRTMLIFCLKNMCGWRDVQDVDLNTTTTQKLIINMGDDE